MREFTKSMMSYTWAMSLFGVQQMVNVFRPSKATESFDNVTGATEEEFGGAMKAAFRAGDNLQRGLVDLTCSLFTLGGSNQGGGSASRMTSDFGQQTADAVRQGMRAAGQAADTVGQTVQGAAYYTADAARQGTGWASSQGRQGNTHDRSGDASGRTSDLGQRTADAVGQGMRAVGQAADAVGQTMRGAAEAAADATQQGTGWSSQQQSANRRDDNRARGGASSHGAGRDGGAQSSGRAQTSGNSQTSSSAQRSGGSGGQAQGWGPMPSQGSGSSGG